ncbi:MAG: protein kinase [Deltaproteobacteria bacterium]|nr:protein kinase [Deltaproteobacteria bacterium]
MRADERYPAPGEVIDGKYRIERMLGEGGMGAVARATHLLRRAPVALKFMSPEVMASSGAVERFLNEGVAASQIDCDNVVKVYDVGVLPSGAPFLVMECLEGEDLSALLKREGQPGLRDIPRTVHFALQILRGLQVAHASGVIHRDMKPSNCFVLQKDGEPDFVKLLDFGISKVEQPDGTHLTRTNSTLGTPLYMAPEQAVSARNADARSDLYSTTAILFEMLTGRTPFVSMTGEFTELLHQIFTSSPPPLAQLRPELPPALCAAVDKGLARDPADRFQSAAEMCEALASQADSRSAQVISRIRHRATAKGPSIAPPPAHQSPWAGATLLVEASPGGAGAQPPAAARASDRPAAVSRTLHTGEGMIDGAPRRSRMIPLIAGAAVVLAALIAVASIALSRRGPSDRPGSDPPALGLASAPSVPQPSAIESNQPVAALPSTSASAEPMTSTPGASARPPPTGTPVRAQPSGSTAPPKRLKDITIQP